MKPLVGELVAVLGEETVLAKELVEQLQQDQSLIICQNIEKIEASNLRKEELVLRFQSLEGTRGSLTEQLGRSLGLEAEELRISKICPLLGTDGPVLESAAEKLRAVIGSLGELVAVSRGFLEQSILGIRGLLSLIQSLRTPDPQTYGATGELKPVAESEAVAVRKEA